MGRKRTCLLDQDGAKRVTSTAETDGRVAMAKRKYEVCGEDDLGDLHVFLTDDPDRAREVAEAMREDLENVELNPT